MFLAATETARLHDETAAAAQVALQTGIVIAVAIGLHNFAEGLAIHVPAGAGAVSLATMLVIGFALHNATVFLDGGPTAVVRRLTRSPARAGSALA